MTKKESTRRDTGFSGAWLLLIIMAGHQVAITQILHFGYFLFAYRNCPVAAGVEAAACGRINRTGDIALQENALALPFQGRVGNGDGGEQGLGIGMHRAGIQLGAQVDLDNLAQVHYRHPMGDILDH